jgi:proton-dependent oligopeptide transporter, POT family
MSERPRFPRQIPFIIGNEACERFSFYGMRNILTTFLAASFFAHLPSAAADAEAKDIFHIFVMGVYFFPLLGGFRPNPWQVQNHFCLELGLLRRACMPGDI